jgi:apolipoprotein N-acyltransferase
MLRSLPWWGLGLACLSGALLASAFVWVETSALAWVALVPLLVALEGKRPRHALWLSWLTGAVFLAGSFYWILAVPGYNWRDEILLTAYMGLYVALWGLGLAWFRTRTARMGMLFAPALWVVLEYARGHLGFLSLPWMFLAHSQYANVSLVQISSFTGAYGLSWLIVLVNVTLGRAVHVLSEWRSGARPAAALRPSLAWTVGASLLVLAVIGYGRAVVPSHVGGERLRVAVVQGNIPQKEKWDPARRRMILDRYTRLTRIAAQQAPELIVWPETAVPGDVRHHAPLRQAVARLAKESQTYLLVGSSEYAKFTDRQQADKLYNSMFLFSPQGALDGQYRKIGLVPFGEYEPLRGIVTWPKSIASAMGGFLPGHENTLFTIGQVKFAAVICWEVIFPELVREFVRDGARLIVNATNEAWFGDTAAPRQTLAIAAFRAAEHRVAIVRAANTGISAFIDPFGRITARVRGPDGRDVFVEGVLTGETVISSGTTFYTRHGEVFAFGQIALCALLIASAVVAPFLRFESAPAA